MFDISMPDLSDLPNKVTYCNWRTKLCLMAQKIINYLTTIILSILFEMPHVWKALVEH